MFATSQGVLLFEAGLQLTPDAVILQDILLEPLETRRMNVGAAAVLRMWRTVLEAAKAQGYTYVELKGMRTSGAHPHHPVLIRRRA